MAKKRAAASEAMPAETKRPRTPRSRPLPEMEEVRDSVLDQLFESIGDDLDAINQCRQNIEANRQAALQRMQTRGIPAYKHAGVEGVRNSTSETLRVRRGKFGGEEADA